MLNVLADPRIPIPPEALKAQRELTDQLSADLEILWNGTQRLTESSDILSKVSAQIKGLEGEKISELGKAVKSVQDSIIAVQDFIFGKENTDAQGIISRTDVTVTGKVMEAMRYISSRPGMPTATEEKLAGQSRILIKDCLSRINGFYDSVWPGFRKKVEETEIRIFKDYTPLNIK
jgi:hypothetical protein